MNAVTFLRCIHLILLILWPQWCGADTLEGRVVGVADGDTITILGPGKTQHKIRLSGIDSPEKGQPFSAQSREHLSKLIHGRNVRIDWHKKDHYGRLVGVVMLGQHDVNLEQVRMGYAWWFRQYAKEQKPNDRRIYELAEKTAQETKLGLWVDPKPMPPWEWRKLRNRRN